MLGVLIALHSTFVGHVGFLLSRDMKNSAENVMGDSWNGMDVWQIGSLSIVAMQISPRIDLDGVSPLFRECPVHGASYEVLLGGVVPFVRCLGNPFHWLQLHGTHGYCRCVCRGHQSYFGDSQIESWMHSAAPKTRKIVCMWRMEEHIATWLW